MLYLPVKCDGFTGFTFRPISFSWWFQFSVDNWAVIPDIAIVVEIVGPFGHAQPVEFSIGVFFFVSDSVCSNQGLTILPSECWGGSITAAFVLYKTLSKLKLLPCPSESFEFVEAWILLECFVLSVVWGAVRQVNLKCRFSVCVLVDEKSFRAAWRHFRDCLPAPNKAQSMCSPFGCLLWKGTCFRVLRILFGSRPSHTR